MSHPIPSCQTAPSRPAPRRCCTVALVCLAASLGPATARAQSLGYEGPTGVFVTPLAYTSASPARGFGQPSVAYHFLDVGPVVGIYNTVSITEGFAHRFEAGFTGVAHSEGTDTTNAVNLSPMWSGGYSIVHGKGNVLPENWRKHNWIPAISVGGILRMNDNNVGDGQNSGALHDALGISSNRQTTTNGDLYFVGTKIIPQIFRKVPILLSGGVRGTDASLWGLGGNAPEMSAVGFGTVGFVFTAPHKTTIILAAEAAQQPNHVLVTLNNGTRAGIFDIPTSEVYAVRVTPGFRHKMNFDFGVLQAAGRIGASPTLPSVPVDLKARARIGFGLSYGF